MDELVPYPSTSLPAPLFIFRNETGFLKNLKNIVCLLQLNDAVCIRRFPAQGVDWNT